MHFYIINISRPVDQFGKGNETVKGMSNMWTPEMGYPNDRSEDHSDRYPIPGVGKLKFNLFPLINYFSK